MDSTFTHWWSAQDPLDAAAGVAGVVAAALTAYLVVVTSMHLVAVMFRGRRLGRLAAVLGPRFLIGLAATATLGATAGATTALAADGPITAGAGATMEVVDQPAPHTWLPLAHGGDVPAAQPTTTALPAPAAQPAPEPPAPELPPPDSAIREVVVHPGDSLWSIARDELASQLGHVPVPAEIDPYWRALIAANHDRLVHPTNPSLIYPGQAFMLP